MPSTENGLMSRPLSPDTLVYGFATAGEPQVSPDGTRLVYALSTTDRATGKAQSQLWLSGINGDRPRRLTWSGERNSGARWSPDGTRLAFVSDRGDRHAIFVLPLDGGEAREITHHAQDIHELAWSPDGARLAYTTDVDPENPDETPVADGAPPHVRATRRLDYKQDNQGYLGERRAQVFVVDVESGARRTVTSDPLDHHCPQWSPAGTSLAVKIVRSNGLCSQLALVSVATGEVRTIGPEEGVVGVWAWSPTGDRIIFAGDHAQTWQTDLFVYQTATGEVRRLTHDLPCLPDAGFSTTVLPSQPAWIDDRRVLFHAMRAGASGLYTLDSETGAVTQVQQSQALRVGMSSDNAVRSVAQVHNSLDAIGEIAVFDRASAETRLATRHNARVLRESPPAMWERFDVTRGDFTTEAWLLKPPGFDPSKRYPVILDVHGGPNGFYGYGFNAVQQCLATHDFLVVFSNPRGSGSYGRHFTQQVIGDWGGEDYLDLMAVLDAALQRPYADAARTGIYGYSYGGYMTAWTIAQTDRFKAAVCGAPVFDLESFYGTSDIGHVFSLQQWGMPPHADRDWYAAHSPSTFAHRTRTPTLIVHGEADQRCPIGQGEQLFVTLKHAGCEVEFVRYPGGSHQMLRSGPPAHRADYLSRVLAWFKDRLGEPEPAS